MLKDQLSHHKLNFGAKKMYQKNYLRKALDYLKKAKCTPV